MKVALALAFDGETAMALARPSSRRANLPVVQPKVRYNAAQQKLDFVNQQFNRASIAIFIDKNVSYSLTAAQTLRAAQIAADIAADFARLTDHFTTALVSRVVWDDRSLHATFSALSEDYDVAATEEASLSATRHLGW